MSPDVTPNLSSHPRDEWEERIGAYLDGELDAAGRDAVERHLERCAQCRSIHDGQRALGDALRRQLPTYKAPDLLRSRVLSLVGTAEAAVPLHPAQDIALAASARRWRWAALAASALLVTSTSYGVLLTRGAAREQLPGADSQADALAHDVLASHVRSLMPGHLTDVASTNRHNVKPWFNGRLDYSPPVYDFASDGFPLVGGRVDYVGGRSVAVLVYQRRQHVISLFVWPAAGDGAPAPAAAAEPTRQGYHALSWTRGGMTRWAISDLNAAELREFSRLEQRSDSLVSAGEAAQTPH